MLPSIHKSTQQHSERLRRLRSDMRNLSRTGVSFSSAHPTRTAIRSGKITSSSTPKEIHDAIHATEILRGRETNTQSVPDLLADIQSYQREHYPETLTKRKRKRRKNQRSKAPFRTTPSSPSKSLGSYRVTNYKKDTPDDFRSIAAKMKKRRTLLRQERRKAAWAAEEETALGSTRSFSSIWTIHSILAASNNNTRHTHHHHGAPNGSIFHDNSTGINSIVPNSITYNSGTMQNYADTIPAEFLGLERMLMLQKEMAKQECRTIRNQTKDEMDVTLEMLPAEFLFEHQFEHYAKDRSMENVMRVMQRLVSNATSQAWDRWRIFVKKDRKREQFDRVNRFKKQKGTELMQDIGKRIMMNEMFRGFSTWRTVVKKIKMQENYHSAVVIQKYMRGSINRYTYKKKRYAAKKKMLFALFMEWQERKWRSQHAEAAAQYRKEHRASNVIAAALRSLLARRELQRQRMSLLQSKMEVSMALRVQCAWRKKQGRFALYLKQRARKALEEERMYAASDIERIFRGYMGRLKFKEALKVEQDKEKAKTFLKRMMNQKLYHRFVMWRTFADRQATVKRMMKRSLGMLVVEVVDLLLVLFVVVDLLWCQLFYVFAHSQKHSHKYANAHFFFCYIRWQINAYFHVVVRQRARHFGKHERRGKGKIGRIGTFGKIKIDRRRKRTSCEKSIEQNV